LYNSFNSATFNIKIVNPCISSEVSDITFSPADYALETRVNAGLAPVLRTYTDPNISKNTFPAGSTTGDCGARLHYIADYDPNMPVN
jgi:hypothetical protein